MGSESACPCPSLARYLSPFSGDLAPRDTCHTCPWYLLWYLLCPVTTETPRTVQVRSLYWLTDTYLSGYYLLRLNSQPQVFTLSSSGLHSAVLRSLYLSSPYIISTAIYGWCIALYCMYHISYNLLFFCIFWNVQPGNIPAFNWLQLVLIFIDSICCLCVNIFVDT